MKFKRMTALCTAAAVLLSLGGCQDNSNTYTEILSEEEIAARYSTTTTTTVSEVSISEEVIIHRSSPHMEELLVGIINAIGSHDEEEYNTYISPEYHNHKKYGYEAVHGQFVEALYNAGLDHKAIYTYEDFTAYKYFGYSIYFTENPSIITFEIGKQAFNFDIDTECYSISCMTFETYEYGDKYAKEGGTLLDLAAFAEEVTE